MRSRFAMLLAIAVVCVTTAWAGWSPEERVTNNKYANNLGLNTGHKVVIAASGVRHLVWSTGTTGVLYKRYYPSSGWTSDYKLTMDRTSRGPSIALDSNGTDIHVVWSGKGSGRNAHDCIYYQKCVPGSSGNGGWVGSPRDISGQAPGRNNNAPAVACYQGHVVVTWEAHYADSIGFCECVNGTWQAPSYFHDPSGLGEIAWYPSIAVDPQDRCGEVFISCLTTGLNDHQHVFVIRRTGGEWQFWENATPNPNTSCFLACVETDPTTGCPHVVCDDVTRILHTYWDASLGWQPLEVIADNSAHASGAGGPNAIFSGGSAFVVWPALSSSSVRGIMYSIGQYGNWTTPDWVTSGYADAAPSASARSNGDVFVVWQDGRTSNNQIWGRFNTPGSGGGTGQPTTLAQLGIELFPNPAKAGRVTVQYSLTRAGQMTVTLLDVAGRAVWRSAFGTPSSKEGSLALDASGLRAGVYIVKLESGSSSQTRKLVIQ